MKTFIALALIAVCVMGAANNIGNAANWQQAPFTSSDWSSYPSLESAYNNGANFKGGYAFATKWYTCASSVPITYDSTEADTSNVALNSDFDTDVLNEASCQRGWADLGKMPYDPVPFALVACYKDLDKKYPTKTTEMNSWMTCLKDSLTEVSMDPTADFFFDEKVVLTKKWTQISDWVESDWQFNTLGGFSYCVAKECANRSFFDRGFNTASSKGIWQTEWGRQYHKDFKTAADSSCTNAKPGDTAKPGDVLKQSEINTCINALLPIAIETDKTTLQCWQYCANIPGFLKGPYGYATAVNSTVDGELNSEDGEIVREKAKVLNDLVTCVNKAVTNPAYEMYGIQSYEESQRADVVASLKDNALNYNHPNADIGYDEIREQAELNRRIKTCLYQEGECRDFWTYAQAEYKTRWSIKTGDLSSCFSRCLLRDTTIERPNDSVPGDFHDNKVFNPYKAQKAAYDNAQKCKTMAENAWDKIYETRNVAVSANLLTIGAVIVGIVSLLI